MKKYFLILIAFLCFLIFGSAQNDIVKMEEKLEIEKESINPWKTLSKITFRKEFDELMGFKIDKPVFSDDVKELANKELIIKGYIIPVEGYKGHKEFIFSAFPYNMCFFCGGAGPETVMEVEAKEEVEFTTEQITLKGKLQLNAEDINRLMYLMTDAEMLEGE